MNDVTKILSAIEQGHPQAADELLPLIYRELRRLATEKLAQKRPGQTLQATALVHEAYLRLVDFPRAQHWNSRGHFFAAAAEAMRRILVENARRKKCLKRGAGMRRHLPEDVAIDSEMALDDLLALDEAMGKFAEEDPQKAEVVRLLFFAGLSQEEAADVLGLSAATVKRHWRYARAWLHRHLYPDEAAGADAASGSNSLKSR